MVSITVLVITYNQQDVIGRALDSVLIQKDKGLKEIVICDDNSTDSNWEVILSYVDKYPQYIRAYRNEKNLGIYGNLEKVIELRGIADFYVKLSGDDAFCSGYFEKAQYFIKTKNISVNNEAIIITFAYESITPNGRIRIFKNNLLSKKNNLFRIKYRTMVSSRGMLISKHVMDNYVNVEDKSNLVLTEELSDIQFFLNANKAYYVPYVASTYYSRIGVSSKMKQNDFYIKYIEKYKLFLEIFDLCKKDRYFTLMKINQYLYYIKPSLKGIFDIIKYFIMSYDHSLGVNRMQLMISIRDIIKNTFRFCK